MKKKVALASLVLLTLIALAAARLARAEDKNPEAALRGTVVDMHCYVTHGIRDAAHTACSNSCIARGLPAGFLAEDGTFFLLFEEKPVSVRDRVAGLADVPVIVRGRISGRNGVKGIQITSIEKIEKKGG